MLTQLSRVLQEHPRQPSKSFYRMRHGQSPTPHPRLLQRGRATINESCGAVHFGGLVVTERGKEDRDQRQHARLSATPPADERRFTKCCCRWLAALSVAAEHVQRPRSSDRTTHIGTIRKTRRRAHVSAANSGPKSSGSSSASAMFMPQHPAARWRPRVLPVSQHRASAFLGAVLARLTAPVR